MPRPDAILTESSSPAVIRSVADGSHSKDRRMKGAGCLQTVNGRLGLSRLADRSCAGSCHEHDVVQLHGVEGKDNLMSGFFSVYDDPLEFYRFTASPGTKRCSLLTRQTVLVTTG